MTTAYTQVRITADTARKFLPFSLCCLPEKKEVKVIQIIPSLTLFFSF